MRTTMRWLAEFTWVSSDTLVAVVDDAGLVTGIGAGEAEVTASAAGSGASAGRSTVMQFVDAVDVSPLPPRSRWAPSARCGSTRTRTDRRRGDWSSSDSSVATFGAAGALPIGHCHRWKAWPAEATVVPGAPGPGLDIFDFPASHRDGWGTNRDVVQAFRGSTGSLIPLEYVAWLRGLHGTGS